MGQLRDLARQCDPAGECEEWCCLSWRSLHPEEEVSERLGSELLQAGEKFVDSTLPCCHNASAVPESPPSPSSLLLLRAPLCIFWCSLSPVSSSSGVTSGGLSRPPLAFRPDRCDVMLEVFSAVPQISSFILPDPCNLAEMSACILIRDRNTEALLSIGEGTPLLQSSSDVIL